MGILETWWRKRSIRKYAKKLGPSLRKHYGTSQKYTGPQIRCAVQSAKLPMNHICYGYAMYMAEDDFDALHSELGQDCDYGDMRQDVADLCFSGDSAFSVSDALEYAAESSGLSGGDSDSSSDSGGCGD